MDRSGTQDRPGIWRLPELWKLLKYSLNEFLDNDGSSLAAALAFYVSLSLAPLLVIVIAIAGIAFGPETAGAHLVAQVGRYIGPQVASIVRVLLAQKYHASSFAALIGLAATLFGATVFFSSLQDVLNQVWGVAPKPGNAVRLFFRKRVLSFLLVLAIGFALLGFVIAGAALTTVGTFMRHLLPLATWVVAAVDVFVSFVAGTILFAVVYKVLPDARISWNDVWRGAAATSFLFTVGKFLIGLYLGTNTLASAYGAAGSFVVLLLWIYYSAQVFLLGAELTRAYAKFYGSGINPDENAIRVIRHPAA